MKETIAIRADGGHVWGVSMGHLTRCLTLAQKLSERYQIIFIMKNYRDGVSYVERHGWKTITIDPVGDCDDLIIKLCDKINPSVLIIDFPEIPYSALFDHCRNRKIGTSVLYSRGELKASPDQILHDSIIPHNRDKYGEIAFSRLFSGPDYFILREKLQAENPRPEVSKILLTMGGSDPAGLTVKVLSALSEKVKGYELSVILGPAFVKQSEVYSIAGDDPQIKIVEAPDNFLQFLNDTDIIISAGGRTLCESAYLGKPAIIIPSIEHEIIEAESYARLTGSVTLGEWIETRSPAELLKHIERYSANYELRKDIFHRSESLIDGNGLSRVLKTITPQ